MSAESGNRLRAIREEHGIERAALAKASGVNERTIRRIEEMDGAPRLEIKARLVRALNGLIGRDTYATEQVFEGWAPHRRHGRRASG